MSWSQGFLNGFSTVNNAIQGWEDRKERREQRDEDRAWQQKRWDREGEWHNETNEFRDKKFDKDNEHWDKKFDKDNEHWGKTFSRQQKYNNGMLYNSSQQLDIQKQLKNLQLINAQRQLEDQDADPQRQMVDILIGNGDIAGAKAITDKMNPRTGGVRKLMMDNPQFGAGVYMPAYQDSFNRLKGIGNSDEERIAFLNSEPMIKNINAMDQDSLSHNIGTQGRFGEIVKQEYIGARPVPGADGKPKPGKLAYMVRSYNKDGKFYDAPVTQFRTSSGKDPVREFSFDELFENYTARANWVTQVMQRNLPQQQQKQQQPKDYGNNYARIYGANVGATGDPEQALQNTRSVMSEIYPDYPGQGNGPLSQAANNQNDPLQQMARTNNNVSGLLNNREIQALIKTPEGKEAVYRVIYGAQRKGTLPEFTPEILVNNVKEYLKNKQEKNSKLMQDYILFNAQKDINEAEKRYGVKMN